MFSVRGEADVVMRMTPADALALSVRVRVGAPEDVRRQVLYGAWRSIKSDPFIPDEKKAPVFRALCDTVAVEVVGG